MLWTLDKFESKFQDIYFTIEQPQRRLVPTQLSIAYMHALKIVNPLLASTELNESILDGLYDISTGTKSK